MKYEPKWVLQALEENRHPFFVTMPLNSYHRQGVTSILGLGTAVEKSRTGHKMSQGFVDKLKETSIGKHLFVNHDPMMIAGKITGVKEGEPDEILPIAELLTQHNNPIVDAPRAMVEHWIQNKVSLGLSFGGTADDVEITQDKDGTYTYNVQDGELMEWSVTPINAVKRSDGSVKSLDPCPGGICQQIASQIEDGPVLPEIQENTDDTLKEDVEEKDENVSDLLEEDTQMKCPNCGKFQVATQIYCGACGKRLPNNTNGNNPIGNNEDIGEEIMDEERIDKIEQTLNMIAEDIATKKKAEEDRLVQEAKDAEIKEAVDAVKADYETKMTELKESIIEDSKAAVLETIKEFINDKTGVRQESRHVEEPVEDKKIVATEDKTVYQVASEKMSLQERAKSSVYLPPVVKGKVVEQAYTPDEFIDMWTHRQG